MHLPEEHLVPNRGSQPGVLPVRSTMSCCCCGAQGHPVVVTPYPTGAVACEAGLVVSSEMEHRGHHLAPEIAWSGLSPFRP